MTLGRRRRAVRLLLVDNYDSYTYNVYQMLSCLDDVRAVDVLRNDDLTWVELMPMLGQYDAIVLSPGPGTPACDRDVGVCKDILKRCLSVPILGVCLGHQALAHAHGASVVKAPVPYHGRLRT